MTVLWMAVGNGGIEPSQHRICLEEGRDKVSVGAEIIDGVDLAHFKALPVRKCWQVFLELEKVCQYMLGSR